jgi:hypothetical protein
MDYQKIQIEGALNNLQQKEDQRDNIKFFW